MNVLDLSQLSKKCAAKHLPQTMLCPLRPDSYRVRSLGHVLTNVHVRTCLETRTARPRLLSFPLRVTRTSTVLVRTRSLHIGAVCKPDRPILPLPCKYVNRRQMVIPRHQRFKT